MSEVELKKEFCRLIRSIAGKYTVGEIFEDFVEVFALVYNLGCCPEDVQASRREEYQSLVNKYNDEEQLTLALMFLCLNDMFKLGHRDYLGDLYTALGCNDSKLRGQVFTPWGVACLCAELSLGDLDRFKESDDTIGILEPAAGAGIMLIAAESVIAHKGIDIERIRVIAQDIDIRCVYMSLLQMNLCGIDAVVVYGDTLSEPYTEESYSEDRVYRTAMNVAHIAECNEAVAAGKMSA